MEIKKLNEVYLESAYRNCRIVMTKKQKVEDSYEMKICFKKFY